MGQDNIQYGEGPAEEPGGFDHPGARMDRINWSELRNEVPCALCGRMTTMTSTIRCDGCWELETRIRSQPELARKILADYDAGKEVWE